MSGCDGAGTTERSHLTSEVRGGSREELSYVLKCEVKWALESITMNKASGGDAILLELFQILKDDAEKVLRSIGQQIW